MIDFARRIGKPDPEEYVDDRAWAKRFGGAGLPNRFGGLEAKPCGDMANTVQIEIERPANVELEEFLKPLGKIIRDRCRPALGEIYLEGRRIKIGMPSLCKHQRIVLYCASLLLIPNKI